MSRLIYACRFDLPGEYTVDRLKEDYKDWVANKYGLPFSELVGQLPRGHVVNVDSVESPVGTLHQVSWSCPAEDDPSLIWRNTARFGEVDGSIALEHTIWVESAQFRIAPADIMVGSPRVIRKLCSSATVKVADMNVKATPYRVDASGLEDLITLLESPLRYLPVVFLAPSSSGQPNLLDPNQLAQNLAGVAVVVSTDSVEMTRGLSEVVGRARSCFAGGARIYWPGFDRASNPRRHPLFLGDELNEAGPYKVTRNICNLMFSVACFRFSPVKRLSAIARAAEDAERKGRIDAQRATGGISWEEYALELDQKLSHANSNIEALEAEVSNLRANQSLLFSAGPTAGVVEAAPIEWAPTSVLEAVERAQSEFKNLTVLPSAISAAEKSPFVRPHEVYEALEDLNLAAATLFSKGGDLRSILSDAGWGKRCSMHISQTTKTKYASAYKFDYGGERQLFEPHITLGSGSPSNCASIHFLADASNKKIAVGHVGRHLPNTKT